MIPRMKLLFVLTIFFPVLLLSQATYYVDDDNGGSDSNDGSSGSPWLTIQHAVDNSTAGDIIIVRDGTYTENINVAKELTIQSENGYGSTTVIAASTGDHVFEVTASNVTIDGFTAYGATSQSGIYLFEADNCIIKNNRCGYSSSQHNYKGIFLNTSSSNLISNNICNYNTEIGIQMYSSTTGSNNNTIQNNVCSYNSGASLAYGIQIHQSSVVSNDVRGNLIENNANYGIYIRQGVLNIGNNDINDKGRNTIQNNDGGNIQIYNNTANSINAYYNYFGYTTESDIETHIYDDTDNGSIGAINFNPWLTSDPSSQTTYYVDDDNGGSNSNDGSSVSPWLTIQYAVGQASAGDMIIVRNGSYNENVIVNKELTIQSEDGYTSTAVVASSTSSSAIKVTSNNCTINGFTAYGSDGDYIASIYLDNVSSCSVINNRCGYNDGSNTYSSKKGIMLNGATNNNILNNISDYSTYAGIQIYHNSTGNTLTNNQTCNNYNGIVINETSDNTTLRGNLITDNTYDGVYLYSSANIDMGANDSDDKGRNSIYNNANYDLNNSTGNTVNAYYNYWGSTTSSVIDGNIYDDEEPSSSSGEVYFDPYLSDDQSLPVELVSFEGFNTENGVVLNWQTATEVNNYGFQVQREKIKDKSEEQWVNVGFVQGSGTANSPKEYSFTDSELPNVDKASYRLKQIDNDGTFNYSKTITVDLSTITSIKDEKLPTVYSLSQNYPNPFNPSTTIKFGLPEGGFVSLIIYNILGQKVAQLVNNEMQAGYHEINFNASQLVTGILFYSINVKGKYNSTRKMLVIK